MGAETNKRNKQLRIEGANVAAIELWERCQHDPMFLLGLGLYWGEGSKTDKLSFSNSDPAMAHFMMLWLNRYFDVPKKDFIVRVYINNIHRSRAPQIQRYWMNYLGLPAKQLRPTCFIHTVPKKKYDNYETYFGILALRVRRSTVLKYTVLALLARTKNVGVAQLVRAEHS